MVCLSETLAQKERNGLGSHDLHTTTLLSYSTRSSYLVQCNGISMGARRKYEEQLRRIVRWHGRLTKTLGESASPVEIERFEDDMYAFFLNCYHLKDWILNDPSRPKTRDNIENLIKKSEALGICADLCNGLKHLSLKKTRRGAYFGHRTQRMLLNPDGITMRPGLLIVALNKAKKKTKRFDAHDIATKCVVEWHKFIKQNSQS